MKCQKQSCGLICGSGADSLKARLPKGLLHALLAIETCDNLLANPFAGPSWEGFVIENITARRQDNVFQDGSHRSRGFIGGKGDTNRIQALF
jgi:hypothetical protein